jgi:predicted  nucleic acid-binding Zn-ribbon protein
MKLIDVQEIDRAIQEITQTMEKLPADLKAGETVLEELQAEHADQVQTLENLKSQRRETEAEMGEMEEGIKKSRQRLMEIKSNIEYKAMLKEIAFKEDQRDQRETGILELMEQLEAQSRLITERQRQMQELEADLEKQRQEVAQQMEKLDQKLAGLEEQRKKLRKAVPAQLLKRYEFIRQRRNGTAVCPVRGGVCMGCHMNILPQQFIDLQKGTEILQCPHCQRLLYWAGEEAEEEAASQKAL